jgi:hypothetical protein
VNLEGFITKKVYRLVSILFNMAKTVCLIPACGKTIERNLATYSNHELPNSPKIEVEMKRRRVVTNGVGKSDIREFLMNFLNHFLTNMMLLVILLIRISFINTGIPSNRRDINHPRPKLHKSPPTISSPYKHVPETRRGGGYRLTGIFKSAM